MTHARPLVRVLGLARIPSALALLAMAAGAAGPDCGSGDGGSQADAKRFATVLDAGSDDPSGVLGTTVIDDYMLLRAADGTHHVFATTTTFNSMVSGYSATAVSHVSSADGETFIARKGFGFGRIDPVPNSATPPQLAHGIASDPQGNLVAGTHAGIVFWDRNTEEGRTVPFLESAAPSFNADRLVPASPGAWDQASWWYHANDPYGNVQYVWGVDLGATPTGLEFDMFTSTKAIAYDADGGLHALFFNSARLSHAPADVSRCTTVPFEDVVDYVRCDRQSVLYRYRKARPLATDPTLERVDTSSLDFLRDGFGRDHVQTSFRVLAAERATDGALVGVFTVNDRLAFFAAVEDGPDGPRLSAPTFLDGRFLALKRFPDTLQPVVFTALPTGRILALPVDGHAVSDVWALDIAGDISPWIDHVTGDCLATGPANEVALLLPMINGAGHDANRLVFGKTRLARRGKLIAGPLAASAPAWHSPAEVLFEAPAGAASYAWCFGDTEECTAGGSSTSHTYAPGGTQALVLAVVRATGSDGVVSTFARMLDIAPGLAAAHLDRVANWERPIGQPRALDDAHYFTLDFVTDPYDPRFIVVDLATGAEVGRLPLGFVDGFAPRDLFRFGTLVYAAFASKWLVIDVADPAHPVLDHTVDNPIWTATPGRDYSTLRFLDDGTVLVANETSALLLDRTTEQVVWGPIGLSTHGLIPLGDERYLSSYLGTLKVYERQGDTFVPLHELTGAELPGLLVQPESGTSGPFLFVNVGEDGSTVTETTFGADGVPVPGSSFDVPTRLAGNRPFVRDGLLFVPRSADGDLAVVDLQTHASGVLALSGMPLWTTVPSGWSTEPNLVHPGGLVFVDYSEWGTIDRPALGPFSLDLDVAHDFARPRFAIYRVGK